MCHQRSAYPSIEIRKARFLFDCEPLPFSQLYPVQSGFRPAFIMFHPHIWIYLVGYPPAIKR